MPRFKHIIETNYKSTFRTEKVVGMFDVPVSEKLRKEWDINLPIEDKPWQIGLIVGASGSGKSTLAETLWPNNIHKGFFWNKTSLLDDFPENSDTKDITTVLSQVGFSSPPQWLLPYSALSNGQKFRVELARCLFEYPDFFIFDEFTSVVDRQVAQVGAFAFQKAIRKTKKQFIAVTCHYDVEPWLQPDWVLDVSTGNFKWGSVRRPEIELEICRVHYSAWKLFKDYHYLTGEINKSAICFVGFINKKPVVFNSWVSHFGRAHSSGKNYINAHRMVVLPDFQGLGLSNIMTEILCEMWEALNYKVMFITSHPAEIKKKINSKNWQFLRKGHVKKDNKKNYKRSVTRITATFRWIGGIMEKKEATQLFSK